MSQENPGPNSGLDAIVCDETKVTCEQLDIPRLREPCKAFLEDLPTAMVLQVLGDADDFPEIKELVLPLAAKCFQNVLWNQDLSKLSSRLLAELLKRSDLKLASEFQRLFAIVHYIERKSPTIADPFLDGVLSWSALTSSIRFSLLPGHILDTCRAFPYVSSHSIDEGALARLRRLEQRVLYQSDGSFHLKGLDKLGSQGSPSAINATSLDGVYLSNESETVEGFLPFPLRIKSYSFQCSSRHGDRMIRWVLEGTQQTANAPHPQWTELDKRSDGPAVETFAKLLGSGSPMVRGFRIKPCGVHEKGRDP